MSSAYPTLRKDEGVGWTDIVGGSGKLRRGRGSERGRGWEGEVVGEVAHMVSSK